MAAKKNDLDAELARLYRGPLEGFTAARNDLAKQLKKLGRGEDADHVKSLAKPTPSAWAVNVLFDRDREKMDELLAAGKKARAAQQQAVSGRGAEALREGLNTVRRRIDELRRLGVGILAEAGRAASRAIMERIGTDLQALALSPAAAEEASRRWLDRDLDPPGFEVLAGLQLAGAPVVDIAARRAQREAKRAPAKKAPPPPPKVVHPPKPKGETERERKERERREAAERARQEREAERVRRLVEVVETKLERARNEADTLREAAEEAEKAASEARRRAEAAELAADRAREKADRAAERVERAEEDVRAAREGG
ncbi:MAG TPA: alanine-zipper protein [Thermoanaerobaculia bacterium]|nr:alanine-zipper protein [Thermoanaerobaculia bacterium]